MPTLQNQPARAMILGGGRQDDGHANSRPRAALRGCTTRGGTAAMIGQPMQEVSTVHVDDTGEGAAPADALHARGYRRAGVPAGPARHPTARERTTGSLDALERLGAPVPAAAVVHGELTLACGYSTPGPSAAGPSAPSA